LVILHHDDLNLSVLDHEHLISHVTLLHDDITVPIHLA